MPALGRQFGTCYGVYSEIPAHCRSALPSPCKPSGAPGARPLATPERPLWGWAPFANLMAAPESFPRDTAHMHTQPSYTFWGLWTEEKTSPPQSNHSITTTCLQAKGLREPVPGAETQEPCWPCLGPALGTATSSTSAEPGQELRTGFPSSPGWCDSVD